MRINESFFREEVRCGYTVSKEMKRVWAVELDLLSQLLEVCKKYNLNCYADAGTLLGTIRHSGFIPWDDDIDVVMFREDYDRLVEVSQKEFLHPYFFQTVYSDKGYFSGHAQLRNSDTTGILKSSLEMGYQFNQGIFIDIFVLDGVTDNKAALWFQKMKVQLLRRGIYKLLSPVKKKNIKSKILHTVLTLARATPEKLFKCMEDIFRKNSVSKCDMVAPLSFIFETKKRIRNKYIYDEVLWMDFEMVKIPVPVRYDEFLSVRYGNYMEPSKVPTTHGEVLFDVDKPYWEYLKDAGK